MNLLGRHPGSTRSHSATALPCWWNNLTEKLQAGEPIDVDALLRAHPEDAEPLRRLLPALFLLAEVSRSGTAPKAPGARRRTSWGELGDFRIIREVAAAAWASFTRRSRSRWAGGVALKALPFAATMDPRHLQAASTTRLRAAASLHHEHIVPVHAVGCEPRRPLLRHAVHRGGKSRRADRGADTTHGERGASAPC